MFTRQKLSCEHYANIHTKLKHTPYLTMIRQKLKQILLLILMTFSLPLCGQEVGGDILKEIASMDGGNYSQYAMEYQRMYAMFASDNKFKDYLNDGKKYTILVPDNTGIDVYYIEEGSVNGNPPRLCNTLKYNIIKGKYTLKDLKDGQKLYTNYPSKFVTVKIKKDKIFLLDLQGNKLRLIFPIEKNNVIIYKTKSLLRY